jgi:hypothetical protein
MPTWADSTAGGLGPDPGLAFPSLAAVSAMTVIGNIALARDAAAAALAGGDGGDDEFPEEDDDDHDDEAAADGHLLHDDDNDDDDAGADGPSPRHASSLNAGARATVGSAGRRARAGRPNAAFNTAPHPTTGAGGASFPPPRPALSVHVPGSAPAAGPAAAGARARGHLDSRSHSHSSQASAAAVAAVAAYAQAHHCAPASPTASAAPTASAGAAGDSASAAAAEDCAGVAVLTSPDGVRRIVITPMPGPHAHAADAAVAVAAAAAAGATAVPLSPAAASAHSRGSGAPFSAAPAGGAGPHVHMHMQAFAAPAPSAAAAAAAATYAPSGAGARRSLHSQTYAQPPSPTASSTGSDAVAAGVGVPGANGRAAGSVAGSASVTSSAAHEIPPSTAWVLASAATAAAAAPVPACASASAGEGPEGGAIAASVGAAATVAAIYSGHFYPGQGHYARAISAAAAGTPMSTPAHTHAHAADTATSSSVSAAVAGARLRPGSAAAAAATATTTGAGSVMHSDSQQSQSQPQHSVVSASRPGAVASFATLRPAPADGSAAPSPAPGSSSAALTPGALAARPSASSVSAAHESLSSFTAAATTATTTDATAAGASAAPGSGSGVSGVVPAGGEQSVTAVSAAAPSASTAMRLVDRRGLVPDEDLEPISLAKQDLSALGNYTVDRFGRISELARAKEAMHEQNRRRSLGASAANSAANSPQNGAGAGAPAELPVSPSEVARLRARDIAREGKWVSMLEHWPKFLAPEGPAAASQPSQFDVLKRRVRKGVPPALRGVVWPALLSLARARERLGGARYYQSLLAQQPTAADEGQIRKDLPRILQDHIFFHSPEAGSRTVVCQGQAALYNVLRAYSVHDPVVGYVQGMDLLVSPALLYMPEETAFWFLERLLNGGHHRLRGLYTEAMPRSQMYMHVFTSLLQRHHPALAAVLEDIGIRPETYAFRWFTLRFATFAPELYYRVLDAFLLEGDKVLYRVALALIASRERELLRAAAADQPDVVLNTLGALEHDYRYHRARGGDALMEAAFAVKITHAEIHKFETDFWTQFALPDPGAAPTSLKPRAAPATVAAPAKAAKK